MTPTINKKYWKLKIKAPRISAKTFPNLTKTSKRHCCGIIVAKFRQVPHPMHVCIVDVQLIFKNVRRHKKAYTKFKSEKIAAAD